MKHILAPTTILLLLLTMTSNGSGAIKTETVEYKAGDTTLKGFLAYDDASTDKRPAVIIVHEWWGITDYTRRRDLHATPRDVCSRNAATKGLVPARTALPASL